MRSLNSLLADPKALLTRIKATAPEPLSMRKATAAIGGDDGGAGRDGPDTAAIQAMVISASKGGGLGELSRRELRHGARVYLQPPSPPGRDAEAGPRLIDHIETLQRRAAFFGLIDAYLDAFAVDDPDVAKLGARLKSMCGAWPWRDGDLWPERAKSFDLFDPDRAPGRIAAAVLRSDAPISIVLGQAGLQTEGRRKGGLAEAAFKVACATVGGIQGLAALPLQKRVNEWAEGGAQGLTFPKAWPDFVRASLMPWRATDPGSDHKVELMRSLERYGGGDPRTSPGRWRVVKEQAGDAYDILMRWLTRASVMQFLDFVDRSLTAPEAQLMWAYRRAFWTSYLLRDDGGPSISAAWVAFGDLAARMARATARATGDRAFMTFGVQHEKATNQSALIMEIGDLLIVDWSHSGKYNVWRRGERGRPALFKSDYRYGELDSAPHRDSHVAAANYTWQKRLGEIIEGRRFYSEKPAWRPRRV